jgi:hypothetical protein
MTADDFAAYARSLGYSVETISDQNGLSYTAVRSVMLPNGALKGRRCDIAIARDNSVPFIPPAAIHTRPALIPMDMTEPLKTQGSPLGPEWQYWSRRFDRPPTPKALWAHILTVLCDDRWPTN